MPQGRVAQDLRTDYPELVEEELLAACEAALQWFEGRVEQKLRRAIAEVWIREEL